MARPHTTTVCEKIGDGDDDGGISGWESEASKMWKNLENVAVDLVVAASEEAETEEKNVTLWKGIADMATNIAITARRLHDEQTAKTIMECEKTVRDIVVFMHAEILGIMEVLGRLFKDPIQRAALQQRVVLIRQVIQSLPSPDENTPPRYEPQFLSL